MKGTTGVPAVDFFNHLNMLYGTVTEFCTPQEASPHMFTSSLAAIDAPDSVQSCPLAHGELPTHSIHVETDYC